MGAIHIMGVRPSFKLGQRKYSRTICGVKIYDFSSGRHRCRFDRRGPTCSRCKRIVKARRDYNRQRKREDRLLQLKNYRARRNRENFMRARFGLGPVPYKPPPPSSYWDE